MRILSAVKGFRAGEGMPQLAAPQTVNEIPAVGGQQQ